MKKLTVLLLSLCLVLSALPAAFASETETTAPPETTEATKPPRGEDQCGEDLFWRFEDGTLTVSGSGPMDDFTDDAPWAEHKDELEKLVLSGVTYIGAEAFRDYDELKEIQFGYHIRELGTRAFYGCDGLESLDLPMSFKIFGEESLRACKNLKEINCDGGFPSFRLNCLWESYVTIYFPADRPWPVSLIQELEEAFHGRIEFIASDGTDPYQPSEPTEPEKTEPPETTAPVETTTPATEAPETQPPATEMPVAPPTQAPETAPETQAPPQTEAPETDETEPVQPSEPEEEDEGLMKTLKLAMLGLGAAAVLTVLAAVVLLFRKAGKRGKYEY